MAYTNLFIRVDLSKFLSFYFIGFCIIKISTLFVCWEFNVMGCLIHLFIFFFGIDFCFKMPYNCDIKNLDNLLWLVAILTFYNNLIIDFRDQV